MLISVITHDLAGPELWRVARVTLERVALVGGFDAGTGLLLGDESVGTRGVDLEVHDRLLELMPGSVEEVALEKPRLVVGPGDDHDLIRWERGQRVADRLCRVGVANRAARLDLGRSKLGQRSVQDRVRLLASLVHVAHRMLDRRADQSRRHHPQLGAASVYVIADAGDDVRPKLGLGHHQEHALDRLGFA